MHNRSRFKTGTGFCLCGFALALLGGCGKESSTSAIDSAAPALDGGAPVRGTGDAGIASTGCERAGALCTKLNECAPFLLAAVYGDLATCASRLTKTCTAASQSDGSGTTPSALAACETALAGASCADVLSNNLPCNFNGTLLAGAACGDNSQCASGFCNHPATTCGVCAEKAVEGGPCLSGSNDECGAGLVCTKNATCAKPAASGKTCEENSHPCLAGTFCTAAGTCADVVNAGQECPGAFLDLTKGVLCWGRHSAAAPQLAVQLGAAAPGRACGLSPGPSLPATLCAPGGVPACTLAAGGIMLFGAPTKGICAAPVQDGFTCDTTSVCEPGAQCINAMCTIPSGKYCGGATVGN
jgi:hypothetical protein